MKKSLKIISVILLALLLLSIGTISFAKMAEDDEPSLVAQKEDSSDALIASRTEDAFAPRLEEKEKANIPLIVGIVVIVVVVVAVVIIAVVVVSKKKAKKE